MIISSQLQHLIGPISFTYAVFFFMNSFVLLLGNGSFLVLILYRTRNYMLAKGLWQSDCLPSCFTVLWWWSHRIQDITQWFLSDTTARSWTFWFWDIPWCPSVWCSGINRFSSKVLLLFLVGSSEFEVICRTTLLHYG